MGDEEFTKLLGIGNLLSVAVEHLVLFEILLGVIVEIKDLFERTHVLLRRAVTIETPAHGVRLGVVDFLHLMDVTMATLAGNSTIQVS